jgi:hypothetical protein
MLVCAQCGIESEGRAIGWRAFLNGEPEIDEYDFVTVFCPVCAAREFGLPKQSTLSGGD